MVTLHISHTALACVAAVMMATLVACAQDARPPEPAGPLRVRDAWARAADSGSTSGAYLTLVNTDTADVSIASFSTPIALLAQLHETTLRDGMSHMRAQPATLLRRDSTLTLAPGGLHVMLMDLTRALRSGDIVPLTLTLTDGRSVPVAAVVRSP